MPVAAISLLTPAYALAALPFAGALLAAAYAARRAAAARAALGLARPPRRWLGVDLALVAAAGALLAVGSAQPAIWRDRAVYASPDTEVAIVVDVSRSMLAASEPHAATRLQRARRLALRVREAAPDVSLGLVSLTDRTFPLIFPSTDPQLFRDAVSQTVRLQEPPPRFFGSQNSTDLRALRQLALGHYFGEDAKRRAIVVLSDAETEEAPITYAGYFERRGITVSLVRLWNPDERVWGRRGRAEAYRPSKTMLPAVKEFVRETGGRVYAEGDAEQLVGEVRKLGEAGRRVETGKNREPQPLAPYFVALAVLPLGGWFRRRSTT
jgi:hypothetical protein